MNIRLRENVAARPIRLLLISKNSIKWSLNFSKLIYLDKVMLMTPEGAESTLILSQSQELFKHINILSISQQNSPNGLVREMENRTSKDLGPLTSFKADQSGATSFQLIIGECDDIQMQPVPNTDGKTYIYLFLCYCIHNKNEVSSLLSITYNTIHPWPRKETKLSATLQAYLLTQHSGTSKILKGDHTVPTVQT